MAITKIQLSQTEMQLITDAEIILTKNKILGKVWELLETIQIQFQQIVKNENNFYQQDIFKTSPKISKGENYEGLPYLILDYPRIFEQQNIFTIRCMFWWGNFFSCTLQLGGIYKNDFQQNILRSYDLLAQNEFFVGTNEDPWQHHFRTDNYRLIKNMCFEEFEKNYQQLPQIKIAAKWPLQTWTNAANNFVETWRFLLNLAKD